MSQLFVVDRGQTVIDLRLVDDFERVKRQKFAVSHELPAVFRDVSLSLDLICVQGEIVRVSGILQS